MGGHGKKVQFSGIGGILADLKHKAVALLEVDKFYPSTEVWQEEYADTCRQGV
jgi:hypothetical protein